MKLNYFFYKNNFIKKIKIDFCNLISTTITNIKHQLQKMSNNNNHLVAFEDINDKYAWANYGQFKLIMMKENGYVNVTRMCDEGGKSFFNWKQNKQSKELIKCLLESLNLNLENDILIIVSGGSRYESYLRGTYAHPDLIIHIAMWLSPMLSIYVNFIVSSWRKMSIENETSYWDKMNNYLKTSIYHKDNTEQLVRDNLSKQLDGATEIINENGYIDIVTETQIIEVKHIDNWKHALGQILAYCSDDKFNHLQPRIHLFNDNKKIIETEIKNKIIKTCKKYNCIVTFEDI